MHLETLKTFVDLVENRSFSKAASLNYVSQSAVSQQVRALENKFGKKLINRGKRTLSPTQAGAIVYQGCLDILRAYQKLRDNLSDHEGTVTGRLKVETVYSVGLHHLAPYVKAFMKKFPQVNLQIEYKRSDRIYQDVLDDECDLGVVAYPERRSSIRSVPFCREEFVIIVSPKHPLAHRRQVSLKKIAGENFIAFDRDIPTRKAVDRILKNHSVRVKITHEFDNIETLKRSVEIGAGVTIIPTATIIQELKAGTLRALRPLEGPFHRPLGLILKRSKSVTRATQEFADLLQKGL